MQRILFVDDHPAMLSLLQQVAQAEGYACLLAGSGEEALRLLRREAVDAVVLDVMMPGMDGMEVCRAIRTHSDVPILMLTARTEERDCIEGFNTGADDYVTKPFSVLELTARVDALVRRLGLHSFTTETIQSGEFCLDMRARELKKNGKRVDLTQVEFSLMKTFLENRGRAMDREELLGAVWGKHYSGELKIVDVNIRRLRIKVEDDPASPRHITTVRGFGYMWKD